MILQALHADKRLKELGKQGRIIIKTSDTDVIVLCIYFDKQLTNTSELWVQMGNVSSVKNGRRFLPIHELCSSLSEITCRVLPGTHALSGCNTTSSFFGNDKDVAISCSSRFVARLYDKKSCASSHHNINKL
jgi:hypothetical protein